MSKLKWNELEYCIECGECGGLFNKGEIHRAFEYGDIVSDNFSPIHCIYCGTLLTEADLEGYYE